MSVSSGHPPTESVDAALEERLAELQGELDPDNKSGPNVLVIWEAIGAIAMRNSGCVDRGQMPYPLPEWINDYLLRSADKIGRLWLGIKPDDDRPLMSMNFNEVGELRKMREGDGAGHERFRDRRTDYVAAALGFATKGASAFSRHDRTERDRLYLRIYDNPDLKLTDRPDLKLTDRRTLFHSIMKNEGIGTDQAVRNRLSRARTKRSRGPKHNST